MLITMWDIMLPFLTSISLNFHASFYIKVIVFQNGSLKYYIETNACKHVVALFKNVSLLVYRVTFNKKSLEIIEQLHMEIFPTQSTEFWKFYLIWKDVSVLEISSPNSDHKATKVQLNNSNILSTCGVPSCENPRDLHIYSTLEWPPEEGRILQNLNSDRLHIFCQFLMQ